MARRLGRRGRPPAGGLGRVAAGVVVGGVVLGFVGNLLAARLIDASPLALVLLNPSDRYLLVAAVELPTAVYYVAGFLRQVILDPFAYLIGFWFGHRVVDLLARGRRSPATVRRRFARVAVPLVLVSPNAAVCMLAGAGSLPFRWFAALNAAGTIAHLALVDRLGSVFTDEIERVVDAVSAYELPVIVLVLVATLWALRRGRRDGSLDGAYEGRVAIVGAGAAGLCAAHELARRGAEVTLLEARPAPGGRLAHTSIGGVSLDLGAEWLTAEPEELERIASAPPSPVTTRLVPYPSTASSMSVNGQPSVEPLDDLGYLNFVDTTWSEFYDRYVLPSVEPVLHTGCEVVEIDHAGPTINLTTADGATHEADRVIVTVPLRVLQNRRITFRPPLPDSKTEAIEEAPVWDGIKVFLEFSEAFYPTFLSFPDSDTPTGQRTYYDAALLKPTTAHVLGLFAVGTAAEPYLQRTGEDLRDHILAELDALFDGAATRTYLRHTVQDWRAEAFIGQAYLSDHAPAWVPRELWEPIDDRVFFAGEAYTRHDDWGGVPDAARSARDVVRLILAS